MTATGEVDALVLERVAGKETERALGESRPDVFFETLRSCGALAKIFPELAALYGIPQPPRWHPEVDTGLHVMLVVRYAAKIGAANVVRFAALTHDLGKALSPPEKWPSHHGHEEAGVPLIIDLCDRLRVPNEYRELAILTARHHASVHRAAEARPATLLKLLETRRCVPPARAVWRAPCWRKASPTPGAAPGSNHSPTHSASISSAPGTPPLLSCLPTRSGPSSRVLSLAREFGKSGLRR